MKITNKEDLILLLESCKATPSSEVRDGGKFYKIKAQDFLFPNQTIQTREYLDKKRASVVIPFTADGNLVLVIQPIALSKEGALIEFPAGYFEFNENGKDAGIRELAEETGYIADDIVYLGYHYQDPGSIRQVVDVYLAYNCTKKLEQNLDKGEFIKQVEIPYDLALELINEGFFKDANSIIAFYKGEQYLKSLKKQKVFYKK